MKLTINNYCPSKKLGLTLIELLVAIAILLLATSLILPNFNFFQQQSSLDATTQEIISALRLAQNKTLASEGASTFGVYFENNKFTVFKGAFFDPASPDNDIHFINSSLVISEISLGGTSSVVFDRLTGSTANYGFIKIGQTGDNTKNKVIFIDASGVISPSSALPNDVDRYKDSRHVEFTYSQNTQNANTLRLDWPTANVTQDIDYQSYLNGAKTEFFWEGTILVAGASQTIKIHTHSLTFVDALFCVHRDRRYNSQDLNISLDGQNLIMYSPTGTTTRGTSFWVGEPQNQ